MSERLNRVFSRPTLRNTGKENLTVADWMPTVDISETESEYLIKAELPEVRKEDVKVMVENGVLTLQGERRQEKEEKGSRFHRVERSYGSFVRSFTLPESVDEGGVKAEYKDGVLALHLPKSEKVKPKAIDVKVA
jgi:HSP20 family protein